MSIEFPSVILRKGRGKFFNSVNSYDADFEITSFPDRNLITTEPQSNLDIADLFTNDETWSLDGTLDDGTIVFSDSLFLNEFTGEFFRFFIAKEIYFGDKELKIKYAKFPLVGFYQGSIKMKHENWIIETDKEYAYETEKHQRISKIWKTQVETRSLKLEYIKEADIADYLKKVISVTSLISIANGNETTFHRQIYTSPNNDNFEIWRKRVDYHFGIGSIIEPVSLTNYLVQTMTNYENLNKDKRGAINRAVEYINSAAHGYIEDRIFRVSLAWELLSLEYCPYNKLDPELLDLKRRLKKAIKEWNKKYPSLNKDGLLNDRVTKSLAWEKLISQMKKFAESEQLNVDKIGINFYEIKELRDNVAHTGKFKKLIDSKELIEILEKAIFGLRLVILRKLGYNGEIQKPSNRYLVRTSIDEFLLSSPPNT